MVALIKDRPGLVLAGKYELLEQAGSGGMAVVWRARTLGAAGFTRLVAIKRIIPHLATDPEFIAMFVEESRVVSEIFHPAVTQIHDFGVDEHGQHFLVMEWVEGLDLGELVDTWARTGDEIPWHVVTAIGVQMLEGLAAAHERRDANGTPSPVFHRDVTPQNVRVSMGGWVKLTDFGIARAMDRATMTRPNAVKGKLSYVAPEILRGASASEQSDVFCAGIVLWEALTAKRLFDAPTDVQVMFAVHEAKIPPLMEARPDIPQALADAVHKALAKEPQSRWASARDMARALVDVMRLSPEPVDTRRIAEVVSVARISRSSLLAQLETPPARPLTEVLDVEDMEEID